MVVGGKWKRFKDFLGPTSLKVKGGPELPSSSGAKVAPCCLCSDFSKHPGLGTIHVRPFHYLTGPTLPNRGQCYVCVQVHTSAHMQLPSRRQCCVQVLARSVSHMRASVRTHMAWHRHVCLIPL